jgi:hypothetical protein
MFKRSARGLIAVRAAVRQVHTLIFVHQVVKMLDEILHVTLAFVDAEIIPDAQADRIGRCFSAVELCDVLMEPSDGRLQVGFFRES